MKLIKHHDLIKQLGMSRTTIWRLERDGLFPARIRTSGRLVAWLEADIERWLADQARGLTGHLPAPFESHRRKKRGR
jgi:predicted DNA-binding transcriptional regulator AlpA